LAVCAFGFAPAAGAAEIERLRTPAGIEVWFAADSRIPVLALRAEWRGGSAFDPLGREGLAKMLAGTLDEGAGPYDGTSFAQALEERAIELRFDADRDGIEASLKTLSAERDEAFRLLGLALTEPRFDAEAIERVRRIFLAFLKDAETEPDEIASRAWFAGAYPEHAYGRPEEGWEASVKAITREDLAAFHRGRLAKDNLLIGVVGDIDPVELGRLIDIAFAGLPEKADRPAIPEQTPQTQAKPLVIDRDLKQSVILFGGPGLKRKDPDYYAGLIANHILSGGFDSRLYRTLRERRGLVYSVHSYLLPLDNSALYLGGAASRNETAGETLALIRRELASIGDRGVTAGEIERTKNYLIGSFPLRLSNSAAIAAVLVAIQREDLGIDYIERYADIIRAVTKEDVERVAERLFGPDQMLAVVVGRPAGLMP
jgi:zinc protease